MSVDQSSSSSSSRSEARAASSASSSSAPELPGGDVVRTGWLTKRGRIRKNWKRRWFVLRKDGMLSYYESEESKVVLGVVDLSTLRHIVTTKGKDPHFTLRFPARVLFIKTEEDANLERWVADLSRWSH